MSEQSETSTYFNEIGGDIKGIAGHISGGTINQYIIAQKSGLEIRSQTLISGSPYLGLSKFEAKDKDKFFGRDQWIVNLTNYLNKANVLLLLGASGSGKSSLIQAGLIPALDNQLGANQLVVLTFVPDVNPFESFYICLVANRYRQDEAKLAQSVKEDTLINVVNALKKDAQWLIFIDQFEELFTRTPKKERNIFIKSLINLIETADTSIKIVLTMRADFLDKLSPYSKLGKIHDDYSLILTDMDDIELRLAIAEPAARNGVIFKRGLIDTIIADFYQQAGSLPLLQYTLDLLWKNDDIQDRILNTKTYQDLGGLTGALQKQANTIYDKFDEQQRKLVAQIFLELIELEGKEPVSKRADKSSFEQDETQKDVLYQLIDSRLLVSKGEGRMATVEVAHEALLRSWKVLQDLIQENEEIMSLRSRLSDDADEWYELRKQNEEKAEQLFWSRYKLERFNELIDEEAFKNLDEKSKEFIKASSDWCDREEREKEEQRKRLSEALKEAELNLADSLGRSSLSLFSQGIELDAFVEAIKAGKILQKHKETAPEVINALQKALNGRSEHNRLIGHKGEIKSIAFSSDHNNQILASASDDGTVKLWNLEGKELQASLDHYSKVRTVAFSPDNQILASAGEDGTVKLWKRNSTGQFETQPDQTLNEGRCMVWSVAFSSGLDNQILASASQDGTVKLWKRNSTGQFETQPDQELIGGTVGENSVAFSPDNQILALAGEDGTVKLWKRNSTGQFETQPDQILEESNDQLRGVAFSLDGNTIATANDDTTIKLWKRNDSTGQFKTQPDQTLRGHTGWVSSVAFSPDPDLNNQILASASQDGTVKLWNLKGEELLTLYNPFYERNDWFRSIAFKPDGKTIVAGGVQVILWRNLDELKLDKLMASACSWVRDYLQYSKDIKKEESDRDLCDGIGNQN